MYDVEGNVKTAAQFDTEIHVTVGFRAAKMEIAMHRTDPDAYVTKHIQQRHRIGSSAQA